ncbi:hypothetical protein B0H13DRAFT_2384731 [Mycena leptocephala]|nr:hypothetical protein B0H13DRAFT_2384731 [Mycena leptocephala]
MKDAYPWKVVSGGTKLKEQEWAGCATIQVDPFLYIRRARVDGSITAAALVAETGCLGRLTAYFDFEMMEDLDKLLVAINSLPASCLTGRRDGPLANLYFSFNRKWERAFQKKPGDPPNKIQTLMCCGKHGLILANAWAAHDAGVVGIDEQDLIQNRVQALLGQITEFVPAIGSAVNNHASQDDLDSAKGPGENHNQTDGEDASEKRKKAPKGNAAKLQKKAKRGDEVLCHCL